MNQPAQLDSTVVLHPSELEAEAMAVFDDMLQSGCSLKDGITAVYAAGMNRTVPGAAPARPKKKSIPVCPYDDIVEAYHLQLPNLPRVKLMTADRKAAIRKLWAWIFESRKSDKTTRAETPQQAMAWLHNYFQRATENEFLMGRTARSGPHAGWKCDLDYLLTPRGMKQVIEKTQDATP